MAICQACHLEMLSADDCPANRFLKYDDGGVLPSSTYHFDDPYGRCSDCGIKHGNYHHPHCDIEQCPRCKDQLLSCDCMAIEIMGIKGEWERIGEIE